MSLLTLLFALAAYTIPYATPNPQDTFYILRGWLGFWMVCGLASGRRLSIPTACCVGILEASTSVCYATLLYIPDAYFPGICDAGIGAPVSLLFCSAVVLVAIYELDVIRGKNG